MKRPGPYVPLSAHYADDEKIMAAGEAAELMYVRLLAYAARTPRTEGWISKPVAMTRLGFLDPEKRLETLLETGLIAEESGGYRLVAWLRWNRSGEQIDRDRAQDRNRKSSTNTGSGTGKPTGNGTGLRSDIRGADVDTDVETERKPRKRARRLPADFTITDDMRQWARENDLDHLDLDGITKNFIDHWNAESGAKASKLDWVAAWRTWVRRELKWGSPNSSSAPAHLPTIDELEARRGF